ncbi:hypothetical protein [Mangrovibacterium lignilyticum]|uniref:hypothetical protein n=1 Tax=Mangrovibacterium lignilyticum TaxID=2668052 RepID=UPI0013D4D242|nr:hypothetical protein [Mangrovibacterium lignilyticum]
MSFPGKEELIDRYQKYSDQELMEILQNPNDYQKNAVEAAREVAEDRGLDLSGSEINAPKSSSALFPGFSSPDIARKVIKSLQRVLYLVALVPLVTAALSFADGYPNLAIAYGFTAVLWGALSFLAVRRKRHQMVWLLFLLLSFLLILRYLTNGFPIDFRLVDWTVFAIALGVLIYVLLYFKVLIRNYLSKS